MTDDLKGEKKALEDRELRNGKRGTIIHEIIKWYVKTICRRIVKPIANNFANCLMSNIYQPAKTFNYFYK